jgi:hypothetical protein
MMIMIMTSNNNTEGARSCRMEGSELLQGSELMYNDKSCKNMQILSLWHFYRMLSNTVASERNFSLACAKENFDGHNHWSCECEI